MFRFISLYASFRWWWRCPCRSWRVCPRGRTSSCRRRCQRHIFQQCLSVRETCVNMRFVFSGMAERLVADDAGCLVFTSVNCFRGWKSVVGFDGKSSEFCLFLLSGHKKTAVERAADGQKRCKTIRLALRNSMSCPVIQYFLQGKTILLAGSLWLFCCPGERFQRLCFLQVIVRQWYTETAEYSRISGRDRGRRVLREYFALRNVAES